MLQEERELKFFNARFNVKNVRIAILAILLRHKYSPIPIY